ncbi:MAG: mevalonate kinase [Anaerolineae bacterium]|nr:mevalonate kinase [Anaerolineae bacterium]
MHRAPAKIILFGEHAVVYGQPAIAVPFTTLYATASAAPAPAGSGLTVLARDLDVVLHVRPGDETPDNALTYAATLTLKTLGAPVPDLTIDVRSTIPVASGLGSGAAVSAALIRELSAALGSPIEGNDLNTLVYEVEKMHHGTPSGIDNTVIVMNQPVYFVRGQAPQLFTIGQPLTFVIADSGVQASTRETVGAVRQLYETDPATYGATFAQIGELVQAAREHLQAGRITELGQMMNDNHNILQRLTVSSPVLDRLVNVAIDAGALGAKLSGGGRGGNVIALTNPAGAKAVAHRLRQVGAVHAWITTLEAMSC